MKTEWKYVRLDSLGTNNKPPIKAGPFGSSVKKATYVKSGYKLYGQQEVLSKDVNAKNYYVNQATFELHKTCAIEAGDILITMMGTVGKTLVIPPVYEKGIINPRLMRISVDQSRASPYFVQIYLESAKLQNLLQRRAHGGTMPGLNATAIGSIRIPLPTLEIQNHIVELIQTWDKAIQLTEQLIEKKQRFKKAMMQKLLSAQIRASSFEDKWKTKYLSELVKISKGKALSSNDLKLGDYNVIAGGKSSPYSHCSYTHQNVITVSASGAYAGYVSYHPERIWASDCSVIEAKNNTNIHFIKYFLLWKQQHIYSLQSGGAQPHIYPKDLYTLKLKAPSIQEQELVANILNIFDNKISLINQHLLAFKKTKRSLMQNLFSGKYNLSKQQDNGEKS